MLPAQPPRRLVPAALTEEAFAPFGRIVRSRAPVRVNDGLAERRDALVELRCLDETAVHCLSYFDVGVRPLPFTVTALERHPYTAQVFLPVTPCRALVVVAGQAEDGSADPASALAFIGPPGAGILYDPGVWHLGLTSLDVAAGFQMAMWSGRAPDTDIRPLSIPLLIERGGG